MVASGVEPQITLDPEMKFVPATVIATADELPATADDGVSELIVGPLTVNTLADEAAVGVFCTVTLTAPAVASRVVDTDAVSEVALT